LISVASAGGKILFAGGGDKQFNSKPDVDIYDIRSNTWSTAKLCIPRFAIASVSSGNKVFFAGGEVGDGTWPVDSVDIYDASSNTWSVAHLSTAGNGIAAAAVGSKVLFAGGDGGFSGRGRETRVDIFDLSTGRWSTASLSEVKRGFHAAVTLEGKVYFAGGETWNGPTWLPSDKVDIYDDATQSWSTSTLSEGRLGLTGIVISGRIFWAGGSSGVYPTMHTSCTVDVIDVNAGTSGISHLFRPGNWNTSFGQNAVVKNDEIIFFRHGEGDNRRFDIYNNRTGVWSIGEIDQNIKNSSIISVDNQIYLAGGIVNGVLSGQVWKLEF
jgi:Galactose oxidase, central domain/Kelch motif